MDADAEEPEEPDDEPDEPPRDIPDEPDDEDVPDDPDDPDDPEVFDADADDPDDPADFDADVDPPLDVEPPDFLEEVLLLLVPEVEPPVVWPDELPLWPDDELEPDLPLVAWLPPTVPTSASTSQRIVVLFELSMVPFSTTKRSTSPRSISMSR